MKRPCALISLTLIFALMLSLSATAHANESISDYDSPKASRENSYRIDFQNDILFNSPTMRSNLSTISESLDEVGIPSNLNWVPADENAWTYAAANDDWNFDSSTDPVK